MLALLAIAACHSAPKLCTPWDRLELPVKSIGFCDAKSAEVDTPFARAREAVVNSGFHEVRVAKPAPDVAVFRRDSLQFELRGEMNGHSVLHFDDRRAFDGSYDDLRAAVEKQRGSMQPLAAAFPQSVKRKRCDDAELLRLDPTLASHDVELFDLAELTGGEGYHLLPSTALPVMPSPEAVEALVAQQEWLPKLASHRVVVGYRVKKSEGPRDGGGGTTERQANGRYVRHGTFESGTFLAELVVFDRVDARVLCSGIVAAANSGSVESLDRGYGAGSQLDADFRRNIAKAVTEELGWLAKSLHVSIVT
jgi:hypothetical protein